MLVGKPNQSIIDDTLIILSLTDSSVPVEPISPVRVAKISSITTPEAIITGRKYNALKNILPLNFWFKRIPKISERIIIKGKEYKKDKNPFLRFSVNNASFNNNVEKFLNPWKFHSSPEIVNLTLEKE